jgi:hypothetical protein
MSPTTTWNTIWVFVHSARFFGQISTKSPTSTFTKIRPVGAAVMDAYSQTDTHDEANRCLSRRCLKILTLTDDFVSNLQQTIWTYLNIHVKCPKFLSDFNQTWGSSTNFSQKSRISNFTKIHSGTTALMYEDRLTDKTKLGALRDYADAPKKRARVSKVTLRKQARPSKRRRLGTPVVHTEKGLLWLRSWTHDLTQSGVDGRERERERERTP